MLGTIPIPTLITPIMLAVFLSVLVPSTSFLGNLCGLVFGYGCENSTHRLEKN